MSANTFEQKYKNNIRVVTGTITPNQDDSVILCDTSTNPVVINLLEVPQNYWATQYKLYIKDSGNAATNNIVINAPIGYTINGLPSLTINFNNGCAMFQVSSNNSYVASGISVSVTAGGGAIIDTTYANLLTLVTGSLLIKGCWYRIFDYATIYDQPDFTALGVQKAILPSITLTQELGGSGLIWVYALGADNLSTKAFDEKYPLDYVEYDYTYSFTEVMNFPAKGRVTRRIDSQGNSADYDHRVIQFKRYESAPASGIYSSWKDNGGASLNTILTFGVGNTCRNNVIGDYAQYAKLVPSKCILSNNVFGLNCYGNTLGILNFNNTFGNTNSYHTTKSGVNALLLGALNQYFTIGANNSGTIGLENRNIIIGDVAFAATAFSIGNVNVNLNFGNNNVISIINSNSNISAGDTNSITLTTGFAGLNVGDNNTLILSGNSSSNNKIGSNCNLNLPMQLVSNEFGDYSLSNSIPLIASALIRNKFGVSCLNNQDFSAATHVFSGYYCEIQLREDLTPKLKYTDNADALIVVNINA